MAASGWLFKRILHYSLSKIKEYDTEIVYSMHGREQKCVQSFGLQNENTDSVCVTVTVS